MIKTKEEAIEFIHKFLKKTIKIKGDFGSHASFERENLDKLRNNEYDKDTALIKSMDIISSVTQEYSSFGCFHITKYIFEKNLLEEIDDKTRERFFKKLTWFMWSSYNLDVKKGCGYYDDCGIFFTRVYRFRTDIEKIYASKMEEWKLEEEFI